MTQRHIHVSDMRMFKTCRIKWDFQSSNRRGLAPKTTPRALWKGTLVHLALERWYGGGKSQPLLECWKGVWADELERLLAVGAPTVPDDLDDLDQTCRGILKQYELWALINDVKLNVVAVEQEFVVPLIAKDDIHFAGRFDLVVTDSQGRVWIQDFKVMAGDFFGFASYLRDQDDQARAYCWAGRQLFGDRFAGIIYTMIRSKAPTRPQILKSGKVSANKSVDTTWDVFLDTLGRNGQVYTEEYADVKAACEERARRTPWVYRVQLVFSDHQLNVFRRQAQYLAREMLRPEVFLTPSNYLTCRGCVFSTPCAALLNVGPEASEALLDQYYTRSSYAQAALDLADAEE